MSESSLQFLPFHALNEFMRDDFRLTVVRSVLAALPSLPAYVKDPVNRWTRQVIKVPGFRNSEKAPAAVKLLPLANAFQKNPDLVAAILAAWAEARADLRQEVYAVLVARGWPAFPSDLSDFKLPAGEEDFALLPPNADRTRLPGFLTTWLPGQEFEAIYSTYSEQFPEGTGSLDEVSLMTVWLSLRLPYQVRGESEADAKARHASVT
jgi:hypothetical protein